MARSDMKSIVQAADALAEHCRTPERTTAWWTTFGDRFQTVVDAVLAAPPADPGHKAAAAQAMAARRRRAEAAPKSTR